jgi:hypothetical protein
MSIVLLNTNGIGKFSLANNNNNGRITMINASSFSPVTSGLIFNLDMKNYSSGTALPDSSGNSNNFTFYATPSVTNSGSSTSYATLPGNNGAVAASAIFPANTNYSKGVVFLFTGTTFSNLIGATSQETFWGAGTTSLYAGNNNGDGYQIVVSDITLTNNKWYYVSMTFNGTTGWTLYINGVAHGTSVSTTNRASASTPQIFSYAGNANNTTGKFAVAHLYNRALTAAEHLQNANYYLTRYSGSIPA